MTELSLNRLYGSATRCGLTRHAVTPDLVMAEQSQSQLALYRLQGSHVAVDPMRERTVLREEELLSGIPLRDVPLDGVEHVLCNLQGVCLVVLPSDEFRLPRLRSTLHLLVHNELRWNVFHLTVFDGVHLAGA